MPQINSFVDGQSELRLVNFEKREISRRVIDFYDHHSKEHNDKKSIYFPLL
jgi:hypothetical protein